MARDGLLRELGAALDVEVGQVLLAIEVVGLEVRRDLEGRHGVGRR